MTLTEQQNEIISEFTLVDDWLDRYQMIIDEGETLAPLSDQEKTPEHLIEGCQSRVWIVCELVDGVMQLRADSDALITKGIAALITRVFSGQKPDEVATAELFFIDQIGLCEHLSPTRSNGLVSMIDTVRRKAAQFANQ